MRKLVADVYLEDKYAGMDLGLVITDDGLLLVDSPLHSEDVRDWRNEVSEHGQPKFLALLDSHPDRVLGSGSFKLPAIAQEQTHNTIREWADTFKGNAHPIGAEADQLKRITGVNSTIPELTFSTRMVIYMGGMEIVFLHRPGPRPGSMWILLPEKSVMFIGDTVTIDEPPYVGTSDIEAWLNNLDELRDPSMAAYTLVSSSGGRVTRQDINNMARFLRKVQSRVEKLAGGKSRIEDTDRMAAEIMDDYKIRPARKELILRRLRIGLQDQCKLYYPESA
jgi:glyoxylase-like metal-dependent hydrolase (beta-lactamase superfamily II)